MKVILLQNVKSLGKTGEIKNVADGYASNFLFPNKLAQPASQEKIQSIQNKKNKETKVHKQEEKELNKIINKISGQKITIQKQASDKGKLFAAISLDEILLA
ncbi:50S ribosomal protein L9, partial [Patescibacteria group bacterium]